MPDEKDAVNAVERAGLARPKLAEAPEQVKQHAVTIRFGDVIRGKLDTMKKLSARNGHEPTDHMVISRALGVYEFLLVHRGLGHTTFVELEDGTQVEIPLE